jgi:hypothetical protein
VNPTSSFSPLRSPGRPVVFLHIGEPKTGTTHFQETVWRHRAQLAAAGVQLPGHAPGDWFRAMQDLRGIEPEADNPAGSWVGEWDVLAAQARRAERVALISQESIVTVAPDRMRHAVESLAGAELHVIYTVRDFASMLPAEWQETVKHRRTKSWSAFMHDVMASEPAPGTHARTGFWRAHDAPAALQAWSRLLPPERIHVVTMPGRTSPPDLLWQRLAGLLGIADLTIDAAHARRNSSVGFAEVEFVRALNAGLADRVPNWFYAREVKEAIVHNVFAQRPPTARVTLSAEQLAWARARTDATIDYLRTSAHDVIGDLDELSSDAVEPGDRAPGAAAPQQLDAAITAMAAIVARQHRRAHLQPGRSAVTHGRTMAFVRASPRLQRAIRGASRRRGLRWTGVAAWRANEVVSGRWSRRR